MGERLRILRMALFQLGFGLLSVTVLGVLNRVMFTEIRLSAVLIGFLLAIPSIISPVRLWLGYLSDSRPILGRRRTPYIVVGTVLAAFGVLGGAWSALNIPRSFTGGVLAAVAAFLIYGMGKNAMATAFQALIADVFEKEQRPQATAVLQSAFIMGIVGGSVFLGRLLDPYSPDRLLMLVTAVGALAIALAVLGCVGVEPAGMAVEAVRLTFQNRQVRLFFFFVGATLLATLSQDIYLEPYAAELLGMSVGQTARLNMYWGVGTLAALLSSGMWLVNRFGRKPTAAAGLIIVALSFVGLILTGAMQSQTLFLMSVFVLGVGSGVSAAGALTLMVDFTRPEQAGLLMGAWTIAHQLAEVVGNIMGGLVIDTVLALSNSHLAAFSTVFGLEVLAAMVALALLSRISVASFLSGESSAAEALDGTLA